MLAMLPAIKTVSLKTLYEKYSSNTFIKKLSLKIRMVIPKEDALFKAKTSPK